MVQPVSVQRKTIYALDLGPFIIDLVGFRGCLPRGRFSIIGIPRIWGIGSE